MTNQISAYFNDKLGKQVHKVIFLLPATEKGDKFFEVCQRYYSPKQKTLKVDKEHEFMIDPSAWVRQSKNRLIQYKDWNDCLDYGVYKAQEKLMQFGNNKLPVDSQYQFFQDNIIKKPDGKVLTSREVAVNKVEKVVAAVTLGGQLQPGMIMLIVVAVAGVMGGILLGYFGLPALTGQHLVANPSG